MPEANRTDIAGWGVDRAAERRPGVPRETVPRPAAGAHWDEPPRQSGRPSAYSRAQRRAPPPVFGTAVPPRGLSGLLRRLAYSIPDHRPSHWLTKLFADRVDVAESAAVDFARSRTGRAALGLAAAAGALLILRRRSR